MDIGISISVDLKSDCKSSCIQYVSDLLENSLKDRDYHVINHYWLLCEAVKSLSNLDRLSKKAAGFDKERFRSDVIQLFQEHGLL